MKQALCWQNFTSGSSQRPRALTSTQKWFSWPHCERRPWARGQAGPRPPPAAAGSSLEADRPNTWPQLGHEVSPFLIGTGHRGDCISVVFPEKKKKKVVFNLNIRQKFNVRMSSVKHLEAFQSKDRPTANHTEEHVLAVKSLAPGPPRLERKSLLFHLLVGLCDLRSQSINETRTTGSSEQRVLWTFTEII